MSAHKIILDHDKWRKGMGGAAAGLAGQSDGSAYAGLDLNTISFASSSFSGSSFVSTSFVDAAWSACQFNGCSFSQCDMHAIRISECTFVNCTFDGIQFTGCAFNGCLFKLCQWAALNFDAGRWSQVQLLDCAITGLNAAGLVGERVDFTGTRIEHSNLLGSQMN